MPTPQEIEQAAGIEPRDEVDRRRIWAGAQALAVAGGRAPSASDLRSARDVLDAAEAATEEHLTEGRGRAIITLTDSDGEGEIEVGVEFIPPPRELPGDEVEGTPAQVAAIELLDQLVPDED